MFFVVVCVTEQTVHKNRKNTKTTETVSSRGFRDFIWENEYLTDRENKSFEQRVYSSWILLQ